MVTNKNFKKDIEKETYNLEYWKYVGIPFFLSLSPQEDDIQQLV